MRLAITSDLGTTLADGATIRSDLGSRRHMGCGAGSDRGRLLTANLLEQLAQSQATEIDGCLCFRKVSAADLQHSRCPAIIPAGRQRCRQFNQARQAGHAFNQHQSSHAAERHPAVGDFQPIRLGSVQPQDPGAETVEPVPIHGAHVSEHPSGLLQRAGAGEDQAVGDSVPGVWRWRGGCGLAHRLKALTWPQTGGPRHATATPAAVAGSHARGHPGGAGGQIARPAWAAPLPRIIRSAPATPEGRMGETLANGRARF